MTLKKQLALGALTLLCAPTLLAKDILTSTPVTYMLATQLTQGTEITTSYLPPKRYGIERVANWFASKGAESAAKAGEQATVALTLGAIWPQDPTYVYARQGNIGLIEIDAAQAISPRAQGVATLTLASGQTSKFAWLNPANLIRMTGIVGEDLQRAFPKQAETIAKNQQTLMLSVRELINQQQDAIFDQEIDSVVLLSEALEDFAVGNQLFVAERHFAPELEWSEQDKQALKTLFAEDETLWLVTSRKPSKMLLTLVPAERILMVDALDRWGREGIKNNDPLARWQVSK